VVLTSSFAGGRGEFLRIRLREREDESETDVLGRIDGIARSNELSGAGLGRSVSDLECLPSARVTGESLTARLELVGYRYPFTSRR
jgi:hypothetical protein